MRRSLHVPRAAAFLAFVLAITAPTAGLAQDANFRARSPLVVVPVTVTDKRGQPIDGLDKSDFELYDNRVRRPFKLDAPGLYQASVSVVLVVQTSGISHSALLKIHKVGSLADGYITGEGGEAALIAAGDQVTTVQGFTPSGGDLSSAFRRLRAGDPMSGRILDGIDAALRLLAAKPAGRRRIVIVVGESRDRGSEAKPGDVLTLAQRENVTIYTISYSTYITPFTTKADDWESTPGVDQGPNWLAIFTELGRLSKENIDSLENDLAAIGKEVHSQYLLSFVPASDSAPAFHSIQVEMKANPQAVIRTRPGYWTVAPEK